MLYGILIAVLIYSGIGTLLFAFCNNEEFICYILGGPITWIVILIGKIYQVIYKNYYRALVEHDGTIYHCTRKEYEYLGYLEDDGWYNHPDYKQFINKAHYWHNVGKRIKEDGTLFLSMKYVPRKIWKNYSSVPQEILIKAKYLYDTDEIEDLGV